MKRRYKILIAVLLAIVVTIGILIYINWDFITIIKNGLVYSDEELARMKENNDKEVEKVLSNLGIEQIRPLTEEEEKMLESGEITQEDAVKIILGTDKSEKSDSQTPQSDGSNKDTSKNETATSISDDKKNIANEKISNLIGQMYVLKSRFNSELKAVEGWVNAEYTKLSKEEKAPKLSPAEQEIARQAYSKAKALESECDAKVEAILKEIETLLTDSGQDTKLVSQVRQAYAKEKQIVKSRYLSLYR